MFNSDLLFPISDSDLLFPIVRITLHSAVSTGGGARLVSRVPERHRRSVCVSKRCDGRAQSVEMPLLYGSSGETTGLSWIPYSLLLLFSFLGFPPPKNNLKSLANGHTSRPISPNVRAMAKWVFATGLKGEDTSAVGPMSPGASARSLA